MAVAGQASAQSVIDGHPGKAVAGPPGCGALDGDQAGAGQPQAAQRCKESGMNSSLVLEIPVMIAVMVLLTAPALVKGKLSRVQGVALLVIYAVFCGIQFTL